jgi:hypothetical protein
MEPLTVHAVTSRFRLTPDPLTIGLSMVNWLVLMLLLSGFMLATTMSDRSDPAGTASEIGSAAPR